MGAEEPSWHMNTLRKNKHTHIYAPTRISSEKENPAKPAAGPV